MTDSIDSWNGGLELGAVDLLRQPGRMIVTPTKVGYIVMTSDGAGLERKFAAKQRARNKPGVVLCGSLDQVRELGATSPEIDEVYRAAWDADVLLGCILPWRSSAAHHIPDDGTRALAMDGRGTSCFVVRFGTPSELIVQSLWEDHRRLAFASSANPSGKGNSGRVAGVGPRILDAADLVIAADVYVRSIQPDETERTRYAQGVMVSMVDAHGRLVPEQNGRRGVQPCPSVIRSGLAIDKIMTMLSSIYPSWDFRQGTYY